MSINITSRGQLYNFPSGTKRSLIYLFLKDNFADGIILDQRGFVCADETIKDGSYFVRDYTLDDINLLETILARAKEQEQELKRKLDEEYQCRKRALDQAYLWSLYVADLAYKIAKQQLLPERRRVRFDPLFNATFVYSPTSCPMETLYAYRFNYLSKPISEYYDIPVYRSTRAVHPKRCLLNDTEGGWVVVSRSDFDDAAALPESKPVPSSQSAIQG